MKIRIIASTIAAAVLLISGSGPSKAQSLAQQCLKSGPNSEACQKFYVHYYLVPHISKAVARLKVSPILPICWRRPCPDPVPDVLRRFEKSQSGVRAKYLFPTPQTSVIAGRDQLKAAMAMRRALAESLRIVDRDIARIRKLKK